MSENADNQGGEHPRGGTTRRESYSYKGLEERKLSAERRFRRHSIKKVSPTREFLWGMLNDPTRRSYRWFLSFITALILLSVGTLVYEVLVLHGDTPPTWMWTVDRAILLIFLVEFIARLWVIRDWQPRSVRLSFWGKTKYWVLSRLKFILSPWGMIDLIALLPIFPFLRSLRILRLFRLLRSIKLFRHSSPLRTLSLAFRSNSLIFAVSISFVFTAIVLSAVMLFFAEYGINEGIDSLGDTLWWSIVTISTVGFGDITPATTGGRMIGAALMLTGMFVIALFAGVISSTLVGHLLPLRTEQVRMSSISDHIIIAGWNDDVPMLVERMKEEYGARLPAIMVLAPRSRPEQLQQECIFVEGDFTKEDEYTNVRLPWVRTVIAVADQSAGAVKPQARDASTVLTIFTVRRIEQQLDVERDVPIHICAEILDPENIDHAVTAGADEIIASALLSYSLMAHTAANPGVGSALSDLMLATRQNVYTSHLPIGVIEGELIEFRELRHRMHEDYDVLVVGLLHQGEMQMNPPPETDVYANDEIVYIGHREISRERGASAPE